MPFLVFFPASNSTKIVKFADNDVDVDVDMLVSFFLFCESTVRKTIYFSVPRVQIRTSTVKTLI